MQIDLIQYLRVYCIVKARPGCPPIGCLDLQRIVLVGDILTQKYESVVFQLEAMLVENKAAGRIPIEYVVVLGPVSGK